MPRAIVNGQSLSSLTGGGATVDRDFGGGSLGDVTIAADVDLQGDLQYNSLVVNDGVRVSAVAQTKLVIRTRGDLTLNGTATIDAHGRGNPFTGAGGLGGEGTRGLTVVDAQGEPGSAGVRPYAALVSGGSGSGGGGGGAFGTSVVGGVAGGGGASVAASPPFNSGVPVTPVRFIGRAEAVNNAGDAGVPPVAVARITIPANTLSEGDSLFFTTAATPGNPEGSESLTIVFGGTTIYNDTTVMAGESWNVQGWITRSLDGAGRTAMCEVGSTEPDGSLSSGAPGSAYRKITVDWSTNLILQVAVVSADPTDRLHHLTVWAYSDGVSGATRGGVGGAGGVQDMAAPPTAGVQGAVTPTDATLRSRIEADKDRVALAMSLWGSPGAGGGGGGGGVVDGPAAAFPAGGAGGTGGSQSGPTGFGDGNAGAAGTGQSVDALRHNTGGGGGGGGGAGGGDLEIWCNGNLTIGSGTINANGGNGGAGGAGGASTNKAGPSLATGGGGGGGGGGSGGTVLVVVNGTPTNVNTGTVTATGGTGGTGGAGGTSNLTPGPIPLGAAGATGRDGDDGFVILIGA